MTKLLDATINKVYSLPDNQQDQIANAIENWLTENAIIQGMKDIENGKTRSMDDVFDDLETKLKAKHGVV